MRNKKKLKAKTWNFSSILQTFVVIMLKNAPWSKIQVKCWFNMRISWKLSLKRFNQPPAFYFEQINNFSTFIPNYLEFNKYYTKIDHFMEAFRHISWLLQWFQLFSKNWKKLIKLKQIWNFLKLGIWELNSN